ncbi:MAG: hypothetical protein ACFFD4_09545 [Candidatus Odinarchaeota archaeon]
MTRAASALHPPAPAFLTKAPQGAFWRRKVKIYKMMEKKGIDYYQLYCNSSEELNQVRNKWYPDDIERIPSDLQLTPTACYIWYIEDGYCKKRKSGLLRNVGLSTQGFLREENERLVTLLSEKIGDGSKVAKDNGIVLNKRASIAFLEYIVGSWFREPDCFDYKFIECNSLYFN